MKNSFKYTGTVRLKQDNIVISEEKNNGTPAFFNAICKLLCGEYDSLNLIPRSMKIVSVGNDEEKNQTNIVPIIDYTVDQDDTKITLSAIFKPSDLFDGLGGDLYIKLLSFSEDVFAEAPVNYGVYTTMKNNTSAITLAEWELSFSNIAEEGNQ